MLMSEPEIFPGQHVDSVQYPHETFADRCTVILKAQRWKPTMASIAKHNVATRGVYLNESNPKQVIAIVAFKEGDDPAAKIQMYAESEAFKVDLGDLEMSCFEGVDAAFLKPMDFSPSQ